MKSLKKYLQCFLGFMSMLAFLGVLHLLSDQTAVTRELRARTQHTDLDNSSLFYTESERAGEAAFALRKAKMMRGEEQN